MHDSDKSQLSQSGPLLTHEKPHHCRRCPDKGNQLSPTFPG